MITLSRTLGAITMAALLSACGGGGGGGPRTEFNYQPFDSTVAGQSRIAAAGLTRTDVDENPDGTEVRTGTLQREDRTLTVTLDEAGQITGVFDADTESWTSGTTTVTSYSALTGNFDFFIPVQVSVDGGASNPYVLGVVSRTEDLPASGTVVFTGSARVGANLSADGVSPNTYSESAGSLNLSANFGNDHVTATISGLTGMPFTIVRMTNLQISGGSDATFALDGGSTVTFSNTGGAVVPFTGAGTVNSASGAFFGGDGNGPVEAGGVFAVVGEDGNIWGIFAADDRN